MPEKIENGDKYVTYKWLLVQAVAIIGISLGFVYWTQASFTRIVEKLDKEKVDVCVFDERTTRMIKDVEEVKKLAIENKLLNTLMLDQVQKMKK